MRAAFFDMDRTVLRVNSGTLWVRYLRKRREISRMQLLRALAWVAQYKLAILDMEALSKKLAADMEGDSEADMIDKCRVWYAAEIEPMIADRARRAIEAHRAAGDRVYLLTSATPYVAERLSETLRLDGTLCSRLEVVDGKFTGRLVDPVCYGRGKIHWAEKCAADQGLDLRRSAFYTDSYTDLPMLEAVGEPVAINPDPRLLRTARKRGWRIEDWDAVDETPHTAGEALDQVVAQATEAEPFLPGHKLPD